MTGQPLLIKHKIRRNLGGYYSWVAECAFCGDRCWNVTHDTVQNTLTLHVAARHPDLYNLYSKHERTACNG